MILECLWVWMWTEGNRVSSGAVGCTSSSQMHKAWKRPSWITVNYHKTFVALICRLLIHETSCLESTFCLIWALGSVETQNLLMPVVICTQARFNASFPRILRHADWVSLGFNRWPGRPPERWKKIPNNSSHRDLSNTFQSFKHGLLYLTPSELQRCK